MSKVSSRRDFLRVAGATAFVAHGVLPGLTFDAAASRTGGGRRAPGS